MGGLGVDITERKRAEEELALYRDHLERLVDERTAELDQSREELRRSERLASIGTLAAGLAHQINNPLGAILNGAELALLSEGDSDENAVWKQTLEDNIAQARRCGRIVRSILQFSSDEPTEKRSEDVNEVVERACELARNYARERAAMVEFEARQSSGRVLMSAIAIEQVLINVIRNAIEQVLINVIRNAIESRPEGARIVVRTDSGSETVRIEVQDNGVGMAPDLIKHIFDPFYTTRLTEGGSGLGLSVAHGTVVDHCGTISAESKLGSGTTVCVELPLCE